MTRKTDTKTERQTRKRAGTVGEPFRVNPASQAKREEPTTVGTVHEGASTGRAGNSTAGGAAGQLTPKDER